MEQQDAGPADSLFNVTFGGTRKMHVQRSASADSFPFLSVAGTGHRMRPARGDIAKRRSHLRRVLGPAEARGIQGGTGRCRNEQRLMVPSVFLKSSSGEVSKNKIKDKSAESILIPPTPSFYFASSQPEQQQQQHVPVASHKAHPNVLNPLPKSEAKLTRGVTFRGLRVILLNSAAKPGRRVQRCRSQRTLSPVRFREEEPTGLGQGRLLVAARDKSFGHRPDESPLRAAAPEKSWCESYRSVRTQQSSRHAMRQFCRVLLPKLPGPVAKESPAY